MFRRPKVQFKPKIQAPATKLQVEKTVTEAGPVVAEACPSPAAATPGPQEAVAQPRHRSPDHHDDQSVTSICSHSEAENVDPSNFPLNCLREESMHSNDSLTTHVVEHEVLIDATHVFTLPQSVISSSQEPETPSASVVVETRRAVTLRAKETGAALTVTVAGEVHAATESGRSDSREKRLTARKPKICLSSNRTRLPADKSKVTMMDLLSYNPPMTEEQRERRRKADEEAELMSQRSSSASPTKSSDAPESHVSEASESVNPGTKSSSTGPRVKIGANGEIVIDEESLVVTKKVEAVAETVYEGSEQADSQVTYASFRNKNCYSSKRCRWSDEETVKFYKALSAVGTDFSLMSKVFFRSSRSRLDLRNKFKKEEKVNQHLIDRALMSTDLSLLDQLDLQDIGSEDENSEIPDQTSAAEADAPTVSTDNNSSTKDPNNNHHSTEKRTNGQKRRGSRLCDDGDESYEPTPRLRPTPPSPSVSPFQLPTRRSLRHKK